MITDFLTDTQIQQFLTTHTLLIKYGAVAVYGVLRLLATLNPKIQSNTVREWLMSLRKGSGK